MFNLGRVKFKDKFCVSCGEELGKRIIWYLVRLSYIGDRGGDGVG